MAPRLSRHHCQWSPQPAVRTRSGCISAVVSALTGSAYNVQAKPLVTTDPRCPRCSDELQEAGCLTDCMATLCDDCKNQSKPDVPTESATRPISRRMHVSDPENKVAHDPHGNGTIGDFSICGPTRKKSSSPTATVKNAKQTPHGTGRGTSRQ